MKASNLPIAFLISSFLFGFQFKVNSCLEPIPEELYRVNLFRPNYHSQRSLMPFFYSSDLFFNYSESPNPKVYSDKNAEEWFTYFSGKASLNDIKEILYQTDPEAFNHAEVLSKENSFYRQLTQDKNAMAYMEYAKQTEGIEIKEDPWNFREYSDSLQTYVLTEEGRQYHELLNELIDPLLKKGEILYKKFSSAFFRERVAYQLVKLSFYKEDVRAVNKQYKQKLADPSITSWVKYAALLYSANFDRDAEGNVKLADIFNHCPDKRSRCTILLSSKNVDRSLQLAKTNEQKAAILSMQLLTDPSRSLSGLKRIHSLYPESEAFEVVLVREINKLENWLLTPQYSNYYTSLGKQWQYYGIENFSGHFYGDIELIDKQLKRDRAYLKEVRNFIENILIPEAKNNKALYLISAGYLAFIDKDLPNAKRFYELADKEPTDDELKAQLVLNRTLLEIENTKEFDSAFENKITNFLNSLPDTSEYNGGWNGTPSIKDNVYQVLANAYIDKGELVKGFLLLVHGQKVSQGYIGGATEFYDYLLEMFKPSHYEQLLTLLDKKNKTPFENLIIQPYHSIYNNEDVTIDKVEVLQRKTMYYIRMDQLDSAYFTQKRILNTVYWDRPNSERVLYKDPFLVMPGHEWSAFNPTNKRYTQLSFLKEMIDLKKKEEITTNPEEKARLLFLLGNGYFSLSSFGKCWDMNSTYLGYQIDKNHPEIPDRNFISNYYEVKHAREYYERSLNLSNNPELKRLSGAMAKVCYNKQYEIKPSKNPEKDEYYDLYRNNCSLFMALMEKNYITPYFRKAS